MIHIMLLYAHLNKYYYFTLLYNFRVCLCTFVFNLNLYLVSNNRLLLIYNHRRIYYILNKILNIFHSLIPLYRNIHPNNCIVCLYSMKICRHLYRKDIWLKNFNMSNIYVNIVNNFLDQHRNILVNNNIYCFYFILSTMYNLMVNHSILNINMSIKHNPPINYQSIQINIYISCLYSKVFYYLHCKINTHLNN